MGDELTRWTIRAALLCYAASVLLLLGSRGRNGWIKPARIAWTLGLLAYLAHVAAAFHFFHHWSHAAAWRHTAEQTRQVTTWRWGGGLYANYAFTLLWLADAAWWWLWPRSYRMRPKRLTATLHAAFIFMIFNATVVFGAGAIRWWGAAGLAVLAIATLRRWTNR